MMENNGYTNKLPQNENIRVHELFHGHEVYTEKDEMMNRKIDFIQDGVQLEIPPGAEGFKSSYWYWCDKQIDLVKEILNHPEFYHDYFRAMICEAGFFWYKYINSIENTEVRPEMTMYNRERAEKYLNAQRQIRVWLSLLEPAKREEE